jgi:hypothetical protein
MSIEKEDHTLLDSSRIGTAKISRGPNLRNYFNSDLKGKKILKCVCNLDYSIRTKL